VTRSVSDALIIQNVAMKAVIAHEGKILLLRESAEHDTNTKAGRCQLPGGRIDPGEPFFAGLEREVMEETGLEIEKGVPHHIVAMFLICKPLTTKVRISEEHDDFQWVTPALAGQLDIMAPDNEVVNLYFAKYGSDQPQ
jgi:8-oxo-dGTP diphosphatase